MIDFGWSVISHDAIRQFLGPSMLIGLALLSLIFIVVSIVLRYHWKKYGVSDAMMVRVERYYLIAAGVCFGIMIIALAIYYFL